jgi:hypothetical protein
MKFNEALLELNLAVLKKYPEAQFFEAQGYLVPTDSTDSNVDGTIDKQHFKVVYRKPINETIIATFGENDKANIQIIKEPWLEDIVTTPYVPLSIEQAIEILVEKYGKDAVSEGPVTLRHQLFPGEAEPRYFIGTIRALHTVNVYTCKVDVPAGKTEEGEPILMPNNEECKCTLKTILKKIFKTIFG